MLNIQQDVLPNVWRYVQYGDLKALVDKLIAQPLTDSPDGASV